MRRITWVHYLLILLLIVDLGYSFYQHYHMPIGGDFAQIILPDPASGYFKVLSDPLGLQALLEGEIYSNPNRFFVHYTTSWYFLSIPIFLQQFVSPIESVYLSIALIKTLAQFIILYLLTAFIARDRNPLNFNFLLVAFLITPLFQTSGFNRFMGVIDQSAIYTCFYALQIGLLLLFLLPYFQAFYKQENKDLTRLNFLIMLLFSIILALGGPLIPGIILIIFGIVSFSLVSKYLRSYPRLSILEVFHQHHLSNRKLIVLIWISMLSLYSLFIGKYNDLNFVNSMSIWDRYAKLPMGIFQLVTTKIGLPLLLLIIATNVYLILRYFRNREAASILFISKWLGIFSAFYLLLLPLGGYRIYRPWIVRYDTFLPITIVLILIYGLSTYHLLTKTTPHFRMKYQWFILAFLLIFTNADRLTDEKYQCERAELEEIAQSPLPVVALERKCPIMEFRIVSDSLDSELNAELLLRWNITQEKKLFYQKPGVAK